MSTNLDFYIQGKIEPGMPFHIASQKVVESSDLSTLFDASTPPTASTDQYWSFLGVQEDYVNFYDVMTDPFYYYDGTSKYYYPLYLCDRGGSQTTQATGTLGSGGVITVPSTTTGQGFSIGQNVTISSNSDFSGTPVPGFVTAITSQNGIQTVVLSEPNQPTINEGTVYIRGQVSNPLFTSTELISLQQIDYFETDITGNTGISYRTGFLNTTETIPLYTAPFSKYGGSFADGVLKGTTTPPHADLKYKSWDAIKNIPYVVYGNDGTHGTGYYYPLYLYNGYSTSMHPHSFSSIPGRDLYMPGDSMNHAKKDSPNQDKAKCIFYNPYDSLMNSLFKYSQNEDGTISIQLISAGHYMDSAHDYEYISYDSNNNVFASKNESDLKSFTLDPVDTTKSPPVQYNVNSSKIYAGIPYRLKINENATTNGSGLSFNFVNGIQKETATTYLKQYFGDSGINPSPTVSPHETKFIGNASKANYGSSSSSMYTVTQTYDSTNSLLLYFIPATESTYHLSSHELLSNLEYTATDMLITSPQVFRAEPKILTSTATTPSYYIWETTTGQATRDNYLSFGTQFSSGFNPLMYNYCKGSSTCGTCFGKCDNTKVSNPTTQCVVDSLSLEKHAAGDSEVFTCNHERYYEKSQYVAGPFIENHSNTAIIIVVVIGLIMAVGFILYEERNRIAKEFLHLKSKS